jgi:hypothetical protein
MNKLNLIMVLIISFLSKASISAKVIDKGSTSISKRGISLNTDGNPSLKKEKFMLKQLQK